MADKNTGWACTQSVSVVAETNTTATVRVICYWQNQGWRYDMNYVSAWVYMNGTAVCVKDNGSIDTTGNNQGAYEMGRYDFVVNKTTSAQSIPFCAKITSNSTYVSGTKWSGDQYITIAAKPSYTVSYNANGGSGAPAAQTKWYGTNITLSSSKPSRTGYTFSKWNTNTSGTGTSYNPGATYSSNANLALYAIWTANTYTVTYNANGGSGAPAAQTKTYGVNLTLSTTKPTRTNYNFKGWATSANGGVAYASGATYTNNSAVTLYAVWELAYVKPRITSFKAQRCTSDGTASESGTYVKVTFNWATDKTVSAIKIQYKLQTATSWTDVSVTASGTSGSVSQVIGGGNISTESSYHVRAYVTDSGGTTYSTQVSIGTVNFPIDVRKEGKGIAFGKVAEKDNLFDVAWDANFNKSVKAQNVNTYYAGVFADPTWIYIGEFSFESQGRFAIIDCYLGDGQNGSHTQNTHARILLKQGAPNKDYPIGVTTNFTQNYSPYIEVKIQHTSRQSCKLYIYAEFSWNDFTFIVNGSHTSFTPSITRVDPNGDDPTTDTTSAYYYNGGCTLYNNTSGTTGTVTLSQSAAAFNYLEIYYYCTRESKKWYGCVKVPHPNGKYFAMSNFIGDASTHTFCKGAYGTGLINGTSITRGANGNGQFEWDGVHSGSTSTGNVWSNTVNSFSIYQVIAYR